jgi:cytochrome c oxidase subunit 3
MSHDADHHDHPPHLAHHFDTPDQQFESAVLGMWLFLATEILLFGGLFCAYAVYRANHPEVFEYAHQYLDKMLGAVNTVILLVSSFTMAAAVWAAQRNRQRTLVGMLIATLVCACGFLGIKFVEYKHKWQHGLLWGKHYQPHEETHGISAENAHAAGVEAAGEHAEAKAVPTTATADVPAESTHKTFIAPSIGPGGLLPPGAEAPLETPEEKVRNAHTFFAIYFGMTGLHGIHVLGGMAVIAWLLVRALRGHFNADYFTPVPMVGLYWHVVDLIWIYLFPLFYLIH